MTTTKRIDLDLPGPVHDALERFCSTLEGQLGETLVSVVLYGDLARKEAYDRHSTTVMVMIVLRRVTVAVLDGVDGAIRETAPPACRKPGGSRW